MQLQAGTSIYSAMDGNVVVSTTSPTYGKYIVVENNELRTLYAHCSQLIVNEGENVSQGQEIAKVGQTGNATGPHLHFEIRKDGRNVNPDLVYDF